MNVLSQVDDLVAFKLTSSQDRDAIGDWMQGQADKATWKELWGNLPTMQRGQGLIWVLGRGILDIAERAGASARSSAFTNNLGRLRTFGLITYPAPGQVRADDRLFP